ncbi:hypothetical protein EMQ25_04840 [Arsenicitalea aurantiaca]|uniref:Amidohydrolase-related domain-containing protein n=1 Tax=Arsenicitalea aurantiaca TaxID=1783274 RepID=A0A433XED0_9HYPH|nr:amidohydrolase family protein [Arsenicitalea aurantiaca]RUT32487.1 hypothetical protein EMQ25_04840 [Arsenicitalea aurantiaca]
MTFDAKAMALVQTRLAHMQRHRDTLVIDGDVHPTQFEALPPAMAEQVTTDPNYFHGRPLLADRLLHRMAMAGVDMSLCWQNPAALPYVEDRAENFERLAGANARIAELAHAHPERVIPAGWTDPKALGVEGAIAMAEKCVREFGMPIVKMNPAQNSYPIDDEMVGLVLDRIVALGAVPAFHFGSDTPFTPPEGLRRVAQRHPDHPVIGVHMGGGGGNFVEAEPIYQGARQMGLEQSNVFYVLSAIRDAHIESALLSYAEAGAPWSGNLAVGSDAPYCDAVYHFGAFRALFAALKDGAHYGDPRLDARPNLFDDEMIAGFMGRNLADLVIAADLRIASLARAAA